MKRLLIVFNTFLILALNAQDIRIRIPDTTVVAGTDLVLPVYIDSSLNGLNVISYQLELTYNSTILTPMELIYAGTMSDQFFMSMQEVPDNKIRIAGAGSTALTGKGTLFYIRFKTITNSSFWVDLTNDGYSTLNEGNIPIINDRGRITIQAPPNINVTVNKYFVKPGDPLQAYSSGGTSPYLWEVTNPSMASINASGAISTSTHGVFRVKASDANGFFDSSNVVTVAPFYAWFPDTNTWQGGHLSLPIYFSQLSTIQASSGEIGFTYNGNILLNPTLDLTGSIFETDGLVEINTQESGKISIGFARNSSLPTSGVLCYLQFDVSATTTGYSNLNFTSANINENEKVFTKNGSFRTDNWATVYVNGSNFMMAGQSYTYAASGGVVPYSWESSDNALATVNPDGLVSALQGGSVNIKATDDVGSSGMKQNIPVYDLQANIPDTAGPYNGWTTIPIYVSAIPNTRTYSSFELEVSFNANFLEFKDVITDGTHSHNWLVYNSVDGNSIKIAAAGSNEVSNAGELIQLQFVLKPNFNLNQVAYVNISSLVFNEGIPTVRTLNGSINSSNITALEQHDNLPKFDIYPNPSNGEFSISAENYIGEVKGINIYSISGTLMHSIKEPDITEKLRVNLISGIYFVVIKTTSDQLIKRLVIQ